MAMPTSCCTRVGGMQNVLLGTRNLLVSRVFILLFICLFVCLSVCLFVLLFAHLFVCGCIVCEDSRKTLPVIFRVAGRAVLAAISLTPLSGSETNHWVVVMSVFIMR